VVIPVRVETDPWRRLLNAIVDSTPYEKFAAPHFNAVAIQIFARQKGRSGGVIGAYRVASPWGASKGCYSAWHLCGPSCRADGHPPIDEGIQAAVRNGEKR